MKTFARLNLKQLMAVGAVSIFIILILFLIANQKTIQQRHELGVFQNKISLASNTLLQLRRLEKDFILRREEQYITQLNYSERLLEQQLLDINSILISHDLQIDFNGLDSIKSVARYTNTFNELSKQTFLIDGDDLEPGYQSRFKLAELAFEQDALQRHDAELNLVLLDIQQQTFEFFSSFDPKQLEQITLQFDTLGSLLGRNNIDKSITRHLEAYKNAFFTLQTAHQKLGYDYKSGLQGELRASIQQVEEELDGLFNQLPSMIDEKIKNYLLYDYLLALLLCLLIFITLYTVNIASHQLEEELIDAKQDEIKANRAKSSFLANMSHEIRTPLNGIIGMTEILTDSNLNAMQKDYLATINASSQTLLMLINDILDLSKIESGKFDINVHTCAIKEVIYDTAALIAPKAQQKDIELRIDMDAQIPTLIRADEQKLRQILMNLASNAIKFTSSGSVQFTLRQQPLKSAQDHKVNLYFSVRDTGIGIDEDKQSQVFEEFKQESNSTSTEFGGTGLGLAISAKMVQMMGSKIEINSTKGVGSEFYFNLILDKQAHTAPAKPAQTIYYCANEHETLLLQNLDEFNYPVILLKAFDELPESISDSAVLLLKQTPTTKASDIINITKAYPNLPVVLSRHNNDSKDDFGESISGYVTIPLLGLRLDTLLKTVTRSVTADIESTQATMKSDKLILLVEDNKINQKVVEINLKKLGINYKIANHGGEALEIYKRHHKNIELILMDCMMPVMTGFEATEAIRAFEKVEGSEPVVIIALTASILDDDIQKCYDVGMNDYLPKPFRREILVEKLTKFI